MADIKGHIIVTVNGMEVRQPFTISEKAMIDSPHTVDAFVHRQLDNVLGEMRVAIQPVIRDVLIGNLKIVKKD